MDPEPKVCWMLCWTMMGVARQSKNPTQRAIRVSTSSHLLLCTKAPLSFLKGGFGLTPVLPAFVIHDLPTPESPLNNRTQSPVTDAPLPKTATTTSSLSLAWPLIQDQSEPGSHSEHINNVVESTGFSQHQGTQYHCAECQTDFKFEKSLQRHIKTADAHRSLAFELQCCCQSLFGRKDNFRKHVKLKHIKLKVCKPLVPFLCSCGYQVESSHRDSGRLILDHTKACRRKPGLSKEENAASN